MHLRLNAGKLEVWDADYKLVATSSSVVFTNDTWHRVEMLFTCDDPGYVKVLVDGDIAVIALNEKYDSGEGDTMELRIAGQGGKGITVPTDTYFAGGYVYSGASFLNDLVGPFGSLTYRHDEDKATPDIGDVLDSGTWADAAEMPFNDANYANYTTQGDKGVVTTDPGGCVAATPGPYGDGRIGQNDEILGAGWLVRRGGSGFILHYGKTPNDETGVDNTNEINLGGVSGNHLIVSEAAGDVPTTDEYFQYGFEAASPSGFPQTWKMYDCLCSLLIKIVQPTFRGITLGSGYASRDREILIG